MMTVNPMTRSAAVTLDSRGRFTWEGWLVKRFSISIRRPLRLIPGPDYKRGEAVDPLLRRNIFHRNATSERREHALCRRQATPFNDVRVAAVDAGGKRKLAG